VDLLGKQLSDSLQQTKDLMLKLLKEKFDIDSVTLNHDSLASMLQTYTNAIQQH